jgi:hypothetical protein
VSYSYIIILLCYFFIDFGPIVKRPKTLPSHGGNRGSNPLGATNFHKKITNQGDRHLDFPEVIVKNTNRESK